MKNPTPLQRSTLVAGMLALASASALASDGLASLAYAGGEALPPEAEARLVSMITTPGGAVTRDEVRQQLADAQRSGTLAEAGEIAETTQVLLARSAANDRQVREILAAQEVERARLAAIEAEAAAAAEARRQAQVLALAPAAEARPETATGNASTGVAAVAPVDAEVTATPAPAAPADEPTERPADRPTLAPLEVPITRPSDLPTQTLVDKD